MYQPKPDFTPTVSASTSVRNEAPSPMKSPIKMFGIAAGMATRKTRYFWLAPSVRATSRYDARVFAMPDTVNMVTGNQTARAISATAENMALGEITMANGIQAVAGIGPTTFSTGIPQ